tara:strand:- start:747 stop:1121 length:375 start_codon:yes stop_codon:yes gene_type:complete
LFVAIKVIIETFIGIIFEIISILIIYLDTPFEVETLQIKFQKLEILLADDIPKTVKNGIDKFVWVNCKSELVKYERPGSYRLLFSEYRMDKIGQENEDRVFHYLFYEQLQIKNAESELDKQCTK